MPENVTYFRFASAQSYRPAENAELEKREIPADESELFAINIEQIVIKFVLST